MKLELHNLGSLITYDDGGTERCLGYLMDFKDHGIFDATLGRLDITPEQARIHNEALDKALIDGLDNCEVGQCGMFYFTRHARRVSTFNDTTVAQGADVYAVFQKTFRFQRKGRHFLGWIRKDANLVRVKRVS